MKKSKPIQLWDKPKHMKSIKAQDFYSKVGKPLFNHGLLNDLTRYNFEHLCILYGRIHDAQEQIDDQGFVTQDSKGGLKRHPAVMVQQSALAEFRAISAEFGMTPESMIKLGTDRSASQDATDKFLFGGKK